ncbi:hypothetical protein POM88_035754 [Heracleum sosnowskyi]|uniref:Uncharacterized protein n=1 Tax=Heracleum sosnowskyi TaxID=360622 RepID=A0AAD8ME79_9APIA|nr:hypothetical protein POM88_035754 [Heracleum sosnowskyi]
MFDSEFESREGLVTELETMKLESQSLKVENKKLLSQIMDQENFLNNKINILLKEKQNLESTLKQFTKSSAILENMVFNSKESFNHEGLGYNPNIPPTRKINEPTPPKNTPPKSSTPKSTYCNVSGHISLYCKAKESELKGSINGFLKDQFLRKEMERTNLKRKLTQI